MAVELIIAPEVEQDIADAYSWYEEQRVGLGEDFLSCIDACIASICRSPELSAQAYQQYRRRLVRRFPFAVYYAYANESVTIYCIFHVSRDPNKWRKRLE